MTHITQIRTVRPGVIVAQCEKHGPVGSAQVSTREGRSACITAARHHDDLVHGIYRTVEGWEAATRGPDIVTIPGEYI